MLARSLRGVSSVLRARHQGCIAAEAACWPAVHAAVDEHDDLPMQDAHPASYATLAALMATQHHFSTNHTLHGGALRSHRSFFSWGARGNAMPDASSSDTPAAPVDEGAPPPPDTQDTLASIDPAQLVDIASMAESQALELAAESAWPNTVLAEHLITMMHTSAGLDWYGVVLQL